MQVTINGVCYTQTQLSHRRLSWSFCTLQHDLEGIYTK
jgi:hypothetical protein